MNSYNTNNYIKGKILSRYGNLVNAGYIQFTQTGKSTCIVTLNASNIDAHNLIQLVKLVGKNRLIKEA